MSVLFYRKFSLSFWVVGFLWSIVFWLPYIILGTDAYIRIHDTLEGELVWLHILRQSGNMHSLSNDIVLSHLMGGLPRNILPSGYTLIANLVNIFGMINGYILGQFLFRCIGYISFYYFVKKYLRIEHLSEWTIVLASSILMIMSFFTPFGLSVVGLGIIAIAIARLYYQEQIFYTIILFFLFPFCSSIVWSGLGIIIFMGIYIAYLFLNGKNIVHWVIGISAFVLGNILANLQMIQGMFFLKNFTSHREAYQHYIEPPSVWTSLGEFMSIFFSTHYHISIFVTLLILAVFLIAYFGIQKSKFMRSIFLSILFICIWQGIYNFFEYATQSISLIQSFRFNRFGFILPFLWLVLLILSLNTLAKNQLLKKTIYPILFSQLIILMIANDELQHNYKKLFGITDTFPSYQEYLAIDQFEKIKSILPSNDSTKLISLGLSPTIAQYHGYATLDGLFSVYSLDYKLRFRKIISNELKKNTEIRNRFDYWGNRCYLYADELGVVNVQNCQSAKNTKKLKNLDIDVAQIRRLGGKHILSACEIQNASRLGISLTNKLGTEDNFWTIYIYKL